jgi:hypothetical protein
MTEVQLKNLLRQLHAAQIQNSILEKCQVLDERNNSEQQTCSNLQIEILENALDILKYDEKFIIETHLVYQYTWPETTKLFSEKYGKEYERSERTLKRIQSKAIKKLLDFINHSLLKNYFDEI